MTRILAAITLPLSIVLTITVTIVLLSTDHRCRYGKAPLPVPCIWRKVSIFCNFMMYCWCAGLAALLRLNPHLQWDVEGLEGLSKKNWYLLICNHRSWADIVVLCVLFRKHIPMNKYFLKQQLARVPFIGLACWALDMPFMKRYPVATCSATPIDAAKMLKQLVALAKSFVGIPPLSLTLLKARDLRMRNVSKRIHLINICCRQKQPVLQWRLMF